jgi:hypothetical protein
MGSPLTVFDQDFICKFSRWHQEIEKKSDYYVRRVFVSVCLCTRADRRVFIQMYIRKLLPTSGNGNFTRRRKCVSVRYSLNVPPEEYIGQTL